MRLDLQAPIIVMVGAWNPAIFAPPWIARNLFGIPEGEPIRVAQAVVDEKPPKTRLYIQDIGITAMSQRVELTLNSFTPDVLERTEHVACNLLGVLPHTPLGPLGINFVFLESEPGADLLDKIRPADDIDQHFKINKTLLTNEIDWGDDVQLNFQRGVSDAGVRFDFNFNYSRSRSQPVADIVRNSLNDRCNDAKGVLAALYDIPEFDDPLMVDLTPGNQPGEGS